MNRILLVGMALSLAVMSLLPTVAGAQASKPGSLTFLSAACSEESSIYQARIVGKDPKSNDHGNPTDPSDIAAYGCKPGPAIEFFMLGGSTDNSLFADDPLKQPLKISTSPNGYDGSATLISSGETVYLEGGKSATRRFSVRGFPTTVTTAAALPFIDLHCGTDGGNNDNADGLGWDNQSVAAGSANYCIAYIFEEKPSAPPPADDPPVKDPPPGNEINLMVHKQVWRDSGKDRWQPLSPPGQATFILSDANGNNLEKFVDGQNFSLKPGDYIVTEAETSEMKLFDLFVSENGGKDCAKDPDGGRSAVTLASEHFEKPGTLHICAFNSAAETGPVAALSKTFVSEADGVVTWRLEPTTAADLWVWDEQGIGCEAFQGATCGNIGGKGTNPARFYAGESRQYLLVTQPVVHEGESCKVTNTAEWAESRNGERGNVSASYQCSGAPTLGLPLFVAFLAVAGIGAYAVQRKLR